MIRPMTVDEFDDFLAGYLVAALWATPDEHPGADGEPEHLHALDPVVLQPRGQLGSDLHQRVGGHVLHAEGVVQVLASHEAHPEYQSTDGETPWARVGHDLFLTRNHHGVGFWDRDIGPTREDVRDFGQILTDAAHSLGETEFYAGDDGMVYA